MIVRTGVAVLQFTSREMTLDTDTDVDRRYIRPRTVSRRYRLWPVPISGRWIFWSRKRMNESICTRLQGCKMREWKHREKQCMESRVRNNVVWLTLPTPKYRDIWLSILACLAFSSPAVWCRLIHSSIFHSRIFDASVFSVAHEFPLLDETSKGPVPLRYCGTACDRTGDRCGATTPNSRSPDVFCIPYEVYHHHREVHFRQKSIEQ